MNEPPGPPSDTPGRVPPTDASSPVQGDGPSRDDCTLAMLAHLLVIFTGFLGPLIIWLVRKDQSQFVDDQGREALNWAITTTIVGFGLTAVAMVPLVNVFVCLALPAYLVVVIVFGILGSVAANRGERYRYPIAIRLISG